MRKTFAFVGLLAVLAPVAWLGDGVQRLRVTASSEALLLESDPALNLYNETRAIYGTDEYVIVAAATDDPLSVETIRLLIDLEEQLSACPQVKKVVSLLNVPLLRSRDGMSFGFSPTYIDNPAASPADEADLEKAREELHGHEFYERLLVSADWKMVAVFAYLEVPPELDQLTLERWRTRRAIESSDNAEDRAQLRATLTELDARHRPLQAGLEEDRRQLVAAVREICNRVEEKHATRLHFAGIPIINVNMAAYVRHDLQVFGWVSAAMALVALIVLLGGVGRALLVFAAASTPVVVTLLTMAALDVPMTVVTCNLPSLLFVLSVAHGIHLVERWKRLGADEGVRGAVRNLLVPCLLTATTTIAGFLSLMVTDLRPVIDFGTFMSLGIGLALVLSFVIVPAGLTLARPPASRRDGGSSTSPAGPAAPEKRGLVGATLAALARLSVRRRGAIIVLALIVIGVALVGARRLTAETRFTDYFKATSEIKTGMETIDRGVVGVTTLEVDVHAPEGKDFLSTWGVEKLERIEAAARELPSFSRVESIAGLYREFKKTLPLPADQVLPLAFQFEEARAIGMGYVTEDGRRSRVVIRLHESDPDLHREAVIAEMRERLSADVELQEVEPELTGIFVLHGNLLASLIGNQLRSFLYVTIAIVVMLLVIFRSGKAALLGLVPSVVPVVLVLGIMGFAGVALDLVTVMIASVAMGIGVDAAIHYLYAYRERVQGGETPEQAVLGAHLTVGRPIAFAALTVVAAFGVLVLSEFIPSIYFGLFTALTMAVALTGTLTLMPACLVLLRPFAPRVPAASAPLGADVELPPAPDVRPSD